MQRILILAGAALISASALGSHPQPQPRQLDKASVLPLALDDHFQFRKTEILLADPAYYKRAPEEMINVERQRVDFKAVTAEDRHERHGQYFTFFWRAARKAHLTVRFEYRQEKFSPLLHGLAVP